jgi:hypothetical protein
MYLAAVPWIFFFYMCRVGGMRKTAPLERVLVALPDRKYHRLTGEGIRVARLGLAQASARRPGADRPGHLAAGSLG